MQIKEQEINIDELIKNVDFSKNFHQNLKNDIYLSKEQMELLDKYQINYRQCQDSRELIRKIDDVLMTEETSFNDLNWIARELVEQHYYHYTNK